MKLKILNIKRCYRLIGIIILIAILLRIDFQKTITYLSKLNFSALILINLLLIPILFLKSCRWRYFLKVQGIDYSIKDSFMAYLGGLYAGIITPGKLGEAIKAVYLKQEKGISLGRGLSSVFLDRLFDLYILIIISCIWLWFFSGIKNTQFVLVIFITIFLLIPFFLLLNRSLSNKTGRIIYKSMISRLDEKFLEGQAKEFLSTFKKITIHKVYLPLIFTIGAYLVYFYQSYLLAQLALIGISYTNVVFFVSITSLGSILPVTVLGLGTRELSLIYLFSLIGLKAEHAVVYSFLLFFSFYVVTGVLAWIGWFIKGRVCYERKS